MKPRKIPPRIIIYPRDVENITGRSPRTSRQLIQKLRLALGKLEGDFVSITEFCEFYGIDENLVRQFIEES